VEPKGEETHWHFAYRRAKTTEAFTSIPSPEGAIAAPGPVEVTIEGLQPQTEYTYRLTAHNNHGGTASPPETFTTKPAVEGVSRCTAPGVQAESATLGGSTLETVGGVEAKWYFEYGLSGYEFKTAEQTSTSFPALAEASIGELEPNAEYHCRLVASDKYGTTNGLDGTFKTKALPPLVGGEPASLIAAHAATLVARVDPKNSATTFHFQYGETEAYGQPTPDEVAGSGLGESYVRQRIEHLPVRTAYHFRVVATNEQDMTAYGPDETFTTGAEGIPAVQTGAASSVSQTGASISGTVDPEGIQTIYAFEVGTDTGYSGAKVFGDAGPGEVAEPIAVAVQDLAPGTTYHYRLTASNADGTSYGQDMTFTTPGFPSPILQPLTMPLLATPNIAFPTETGATTTTTTKALTRAQKLAKALKQCEQDKGKSKRAKCKKQARKRYGAKAKKNINVK
jgi:phosphodiesterase/alkaline phosphatase D-like protein